MQLTQKYSPQQQHPMSSSRPPQQEQGGPRLMRLTGIGECRSVFIERYFGHTFLDSQHGADRISDLFCQGTRSTESDQFRRGLQARQP